MTAIAKTTTRNYSKTELFDGYETCKRRAIYCAECRKTTKPITLATTPPPALGNRQNAHATITEAAGNALTVAQGGYRKPALDRTTANRPPVKATRPNPAGFLIRWRR